MGFVCTLLVFNTLQFIARMLYNELSTFVFQCFFRSPNRKLAHANLCKVRIAEQMEVSGPNLGLPYTKAMGGGLFEIRARGSEGIGRAFFCCMGEQKIVILHGFIKKTQTTPRREMRLALKRMKEVKNA